MSARYTIREVCEALNLKPHVVRYWEHSVEMLSPDKTLSGHRLYGSAELHLLARIKHLVHDLHYSVAGASERLLSERTGKRADVTAQIEAIRDDLVRLLQTVRRRRAAGRVADNVSDEPNSTPV